jgi:hypothetical protein
VELSARFRKRTLIFPFIVSALRHRLDKHGRGQRQTQSIPAPERGEAMMKRASALVLCLFPAIIFPARAEGDKPSAPAQAKVSWVIEMSRSGGMRPRKESVQISSNGEISVTSERFERGKTIVECSLKEKLSNEDLLELRQAVRSAQYNTWLERYEDPEHPICCDQPTTHLTLRRRGAGGQTVTHSTSWYPGSSDLRPAGLEKLSTLGQTLWNKTRERCAN